MQTIYYPQTFMFELKMFGNGICFILEFENLNVSPSNYVIKTNTQQTSEYKAKRYFN